jgi:hypothetical protein
MLGMEYEAGAAGSAGQVYKLEDNKENTFKVGNCEITVVVADD